MDDKSRDIILKIWVVHDIEIKGFLDWNFYDCETEDE